MPLEEVRKSNWRICHFRGIMEIENFDFTCLFTGKRITKSTCGVSTAASALSLYGVFGKRVINIYSLMLCKE